MAQDKIIQFDDTTSYCSPLIEPILWGHSDPLCHALSLSLLLSLASLWTSILHCHSPGVATVARRLRYSYSWLRLILVVVLTVATPGEWQCKIRTAEQVACGGSQWRMGPSRDKLPVLDHFRFRFRDRRHFVYRCSNFLKIKFKKY